MPGGYYAGVIGMAEKVALKQADWLFFAALKKGKCIELFHCDFD
jgi:hypothetical protein